MPPTTSCAEYFRVKSKRRHEERQQAAKMQKLAADVETNMATIPQVVGRTEPRRRNGRGYLTLKNPLPVDEEVGFEEADHIYTMYRTDGSTFQVMRSTTGLVHDCFAPFVARSGTHTKVDKAGKEVPIIGTVDKFYNIWKRNQSTKYWEIIKLTTPEYGELYTDVEAMDKIAESWTHAGEEACRLGTLFHLYCELLWDQPVASLEELDMDRQSLWREEKYSEVHTEIQHYHDFLKSDWVRKFQLRKYRSELSIHYTRDGVTACAGQIDGLYIATYPSTGEHFYVMIDYKRIKAEKDCTRHKRPFKDENGPQMGQGPMAAYPDIEFYHYSLQQSIYTTMLKRCTGIDVTGRAYLLRVHSELHKYELIKCDDLAHEAQVVLDRELRRVKTLLDVGE
jgi:hypothetical protein